MSRIMLCLLLLVTSVSPGWGAEIIGTLQKMSGRVTIRNTVTVAYQDARPGLALPEGVWIKTGKTGWADLKLIDGSTFTIANNTEIELTRLVFGKQKREGLVNLVQGKLRASIVKLAGQQTDIKVKSGTAVAGIKGTEFMMLTVGPANVFFGTAGTVSISGAAEEFFQPLHPQTMTETTRGFTPTDPVKIEPGTPLAEAMGALSGITGAEPPLEWFTADNLPNIIARWNINHGHYLADSGKYDQAIHVFQIAIDLSTNADIRADARMERGAVYGRFLNNPRAALAEYLLVLEEYPRIPKAENALYQAGQVLTELGLLDQARLRFNQYLTEFPNGRFRSSVETLLKQLGK